MNLKPNLWTLLFVLAAAGWFYTYNSKEGGLLGSNNNDGVVISEDYRVYADKYKKIRGGYKALKSILDTSSIKLPYNYTWDQIVVVAIQENLVNIKRVKF